MDLKKKRLKIGMLLLIGASFVTLNAPVKAKAEKKIEEPKKLIELISSRSLSMSNEALSLIPAKAEPEEHLQARVEVEERLWSEAKEVAETEAELQTKQRHEDWMNAFPQVDGTSVVANFLNEIALDSVKIAKEANIYPSVMMAQAALESNWGRSGLTKNYNNLFGIKGSFRGSRATLKTWEDTSAGAITIQAGFRAYPDKMSSLLDYAELLNGGLKSNPYFYRGTWRSETSSYKDATAYLEGRYATDTRYASKLNALIEEFGLQRFDNVVPEDTSVITIEPVVEDSVLSDDLYVVKAGDSVQYILAKFKLSMDEFLELNELEEPEVHINQIIQVKGTDTDVVVDDTLVTDATTSTDSLFHFNK